MAKKNTGIQVSLVDSKSGSAIRLTMEFDKPRDVIRLLKIAESHTDEILKELRSLEAWYREHREELGPDKCAAEDNVPEECGTFIEYMMREVDPDLPPDWQAP